MKMLIRLCLILPLAALPAFAQVSATQVVKWDALLPASVAIKNPFDSLTKDQLDDLRYILRFEMRAGQSDNAEELAKVDALRGELTEEGLDVDGLFAARLKLMEQRKAAAIAVNEGLVGESVRLPGYVLPLRLEGKKAVEFLLVPTVGACIHTPPPPANQIVHVVYPQGVEVVGLFTPVWISGEMEAEPSIQNIGYVDGRASVSISYKMRPYDVKKFGD